MAYEESVKDSIQLKSELINIIPNSLLTFGAKLAESRLTKNITTFQLELNHRLIYVYQFYKVCKFHVRTTKQGNFIKV